MWRNCEEEKVQCVNKEIGNVYNRMKMHLDVHKRIMIKISTTITTIFHSTRKYDTVPQWKHTCQKWMLQQDEA